jgi:hypothetical protein
MTREEIIAANPLPHFLAERGYELRQVGKNFVTNACPVAQHKKYHRCVTIDTDKNLWHCNDCEQGGTVIDWEMIEKDVIVADAMRMLGGERNSSELRSNKSTNRPPRHLIVETYDYTDEAGELLSQCVRHLPKGFSQRRPDGKGGWIWNLEGVRRVLYRLPELLRDLKRGLPVIVCEGEKDVNALAKLGFPAAVTCNPLGAGKWREKYSETLRGAVVYVIADKEEKGREHAQQVAASSHGKAKRVAVLELPDRNCHKVKDASDWLAAGGTVRELAELLESAPEWTPPSKPTSAHTEPPRVATLAPPVELLTFEQWRAVIEANFPMLVRPAEICLSVVAQLLLNDVSNPFALALVDVPASGKTITLNFFDGGTELTYTTDNFTPASFVSHASNVRREDLGKVDLLPRIRYRTLIVRELGSIFGAKDDDLIKSLGILTRVLDGEGLETDSGVHGRRGYKGDYLFMLLAGTPPIPPRVFKIMGNFGSRLFFLSLHTPDEDDDELIAQNKGTTRKLKESRCKRATENFLRSLWATNPEGVEWNKSGDPDDCLRVIARCARLLAALRGAINVWHSDEGGEKLSHNVPVIEKPYRINCLLYNLARAHALVCGRRQLTTHDLWPVLDITFDSAPTIRAKVFRGLIEAGGTLNTSEVVKLLRCSRPTALKEMEALSVLGVADKTAEDQDEPGRPETQITLASAFGWFGSDECKSLMGSVTDIEGGNLFKTELLQGIKKEFPPCVTVKDGSALNVDSFLPAGQSTGKEKLRL